MDLISTSWTCQRCGAALISTPPEDGLCNKIKKNLDCRSKMRQ